MWSDKDTVLGLQANPQGYRLWKSKARSYLSFKSPSITKILDWAEKQTEAITEDREAFARQVTWGYDVAQASAVIFTALQVTVSDRLRMTKPQQAGAGR